MSSSPPLSSPAWDTGSRSTPTGPSSPPQVAVLSLPFRSTPPAGVSTEPPFLSGDLHQQDPQLSRTGLLTPLASQGTGSRPPIFRFGESESQHKFSATPVTPHSSTQLSSPGLWSIQSGSKPSAFAPSGSQPTTPAFQFTGAQSSQSAGGKCTPARTATNASSTHLFGTRALETSDFSFRAHHNVTPLPSPSPSPRLLPDPFSKISGIRPIGLDVSQSGVAKADGSTPGVNSDKALVPINPRQVSTPGIAADTSVVATLSLEITHRSENPNAVADGSSVGQVLDLFQSKVDAPPYDVRDEQAPAHRFFSPAFQSTLLQGLDVAKNTVAAIENMGDLTTSDESLRRLLEEAKNLCTFRASDTRTIAVLGDSGEGKSSLINSLLHFPGVAKTGDIGSACTSVVTEYRQKTADHLTTIAIEVEYLSGAEIEDVIKELLWSYRQLYLPGVESDETSAQDYARYERESAQAWSALEAAFKHQTLFKEEYLRDMSEGASERITQRLVKWAREIEWPNTGEDGLWKASAETAEECCAKTAVFMQDRYWPFTKVIRVYLDAQILKTGVVLADLPGLQDTNLARVRATQHYLMKCHNIFIVAKISRAITDQSLKSSLFSVLSRHVPLEWEESAAKSLNIAVVCTKSDDINLQTARQEFCGHGKKITLAVMDKLDGEVGRAKAAGDRDLKRKLKQRRELLLIEARNAHVKDGLQKAYAAKAPEGKLEVFCVSNRLYEKQARKGNSELVVASGIPELRRFCHSITAEAQLRKARHLLRSALLSVVNSVGIWASGYLRGNAEAAESRAAMGKILLAVGKLTLDGDLAIHELGKNFRSCFEEQILKLLDNRHSTWEDAAAVEARRWEGWHWSQYNSWCLHNGNHSTPKRPHEDWNAKIIWKMRTELAYQWDLVEDEISVVFDELLKTVKQLLADFRGMVQGSAPDDFRMSLMDGIDSSMRDWEYKLALAQQKFAREVKLVRRCASESNSTSHILGEMIPAYRSASNQFGTGKAARQRHIINGQITSGTLFPNISIAIAGQMNHLRIQLEEELSKALGDVVDRIREIVTLAMPPRVEVIRGEEGRHSASARELRKTIKELKEEVRKLGSLVAE